MGGGSESGNGHSWPKWAEVVNVSKSFNRNSIGFTILPETGNGHLEAVLELFLVIR